MHSTGCGMRRLLPPLAMALAVLLAPSAGLGAAPEGGAGAARGEALDAGPKAADGGTAQEAELGDGGTAAVVYQTVAGRVARIDRAHARVVIEEAGRPVEVSYDRDTAVFLESHLGTVRDVVPGAQVRVSADRDGLAYWIEVRTLEGSSAGEPGNGRADAGATVGPAPAAPGSGAAAPSR